jgi:hypothetical protein
MKVPKPISERVATFNLPRKVCVELFNRVHAEIPAFYDRRKMFRSSRRPDTHYKHTLVIRFGGRSHAFTCIIDDALSPDYLQLDGIDYKVR